jgi:hypothetical protein
MKPILFIRSLGISGLLLLLTSWSAQVLATSAPIYSFTGADGSSIKQYCTVCLGSVAAPEKATDSNFTTAATLQVPLSLLGERIGLRMDMASTVPANYRAGVVVQRNGALLDLLNVSLANQIRIRTYMKGSNTVVESHVVDAAVVGALLDGSSPMRLEFLTTKPFNQIEISAASLVSAAYGLDVYYAYGIDANVVTTTKGYVSRFTGNSADNYSTKIQSGDLISVCANSNIINPGNTVDNDLNNYATFGAFLGVNCPTTLQTQLENKAPAGYQAGFVIGNGSVLDANVLSGLTVTTYLNGVAQETASGGQLLGLNLLSDGKYTVNFESSKAFDRVEIRQNSALSALNDLRVYYGYGLEPSTFRDQEPILSNFSSPANQYQASQYGANGLLCLACGITNPQSAADGDLKNNFAEINNGIGVLGTTRLKLKMNGPGLAGNTAGVVLSGGSRLLDASLLSSIRVKTYSGADGGTLVESAGGASLLHLELLADGRQEVSFATTQNFDWVEIEIANGVSLLDATKIYYAFAEDRPTGFPARIAVPAPLPVELVQFSAKPVGNGVEVAWLTASERNSSHFIVERASGPKEQGFEAIGRIAAAGASAARRSYSFRDEQAANQGAATLYYRLRQVDQDGTEQFSAVVAVALKKPTQIALYPNPAASTDNVRLVVPVSSEGLQVAIYNAQAQLVSQQSLTSREASLATSGLRAGIYQVAVLDAAGQRVATQRLVVVGR